MSDLYAPGADLAEAARRDTPGAQRRIFLDTAGSSLMPAPVLEAVTDHLRLEAEVGGYAAKALREDALEDAYRALARLVNARPEEIALLENATRAWDQAFYGLRFRPGDRILTDVSCYGSNYLAFLQTAQRSGVEIVVVPDSPSGDLDLEALDQELGRGAALLAVTWVPTAGGRVNPAGEAGKRARARGVPYLLDACQAVGQVPVDVNELGCDFLSATGRKYLRGPRGTGFLYCRHAILERAEPAVVDVRAAHWSAPDRYELRPDARRFETWEMNFAGVLGLGRAARYTEQFPVRRTWPRIQALGARLRGRLNRIPGVRTHDTGRVQGGIVTFTVDGRGAQDVKSRLEDAGAVVSVSSPDGQLLDFERRGLPPLVRASVHYFNTDAEIDRFSELVAEVAPRAR